VKVNSLSVARAELPMAVVKAEMKRRCGSVLRSGSVSRSPPKIRRLSDFSENLSDRTQPRLAWRPCHPTDAQGLFIDNALTSLLACFLRRDTGRSLG
jgi:hypothetical protein